MKDFIRRWVAYLRREITATALKEILNWIILAVVALAGTALLAVLVDILQLDVTAPTWDAVRIRTLTFFSTFWQAPLASTTNALTEDWIRSGATLLLLSGYIVLSVLLLRARRRLKETKTPIGLVVLAGLGARWPNAKQFSPGSTLWADIRADIDRPDNLMLYVLAASGADTFCRQGSLLHDSMQKFQGTIQVILCNPESDEIARRAQAISLAPGEYKKNIEASVRRLRDLKRRQHHTIEGRFYDGQPSWRMIITDRTAWVQYYMPSGPNVVETPIWRFDITKSGHGLFHLYFLEFGRIWNSCEHLPMNL